MKPTPRTKPTLCVFAVELCRMMMRWICGSVTVRPLVVALVARTIAAAWYCAEVSVTLPAVTLASKVAEMELASRSALALAVTSFWFWLATMSVRPRFATPVIRSPLPRCRGPRCC